ncbi:MAG: lipoate--protein ligase family protein [Gemmatales bacterium]|nr:lipoate--protein ligase family protein [Gemmatales bacterium]
MHYLELTLPTIEENLALDEALLLQAERGEGGAVLRCWEIDRPAVVVGMNGVLASEVRLDVCRGDDIPVARRCSGGGAVVLAPGSLVFALVLPMNEGSVLAVREAVLSILGALAQALRVWGVETYPAGSSDLVWQGRKVSGNSQRRLRRYFLHHGTLLYNFDVELAERYLPLPPRTPAYRQGRGHREFLANLPLPRQNLLACLRQAYAAQTPRSDWPATLVEDLVRERYACRDWLKRR